MRPLKAQYLLLGSGAIGLESIVLRPRSFIRQSTVRWKSVLQRASSQASSLETRIRVGGLVSLHERQGSSIRV